MKNLIFIIAIVLNIMNISAQEKDEIIVQKGKVWPKSSKKGITYKVPDKVSEKFEGEWIYKDANTTFKVQIMSVKELSKITGNYVKVLKGIYCHSNTSNDCKYSNESNKTLVYESEWDDQFEDKICFSFFDTGYKKYGKVTFEILKNGKASWTLVETERGKVTFDRTKPKKGFSVPTSLILNKQK
ncbi:DUF6705 family protein [Winogradskyella luteola]|uniref:DUF6705 domain-containing protein n=1 Tax=Winogradskyella luteola TaxID=2828330 RepID=A0A9X1F952_9FLAO|nr:DUF6705 family protein [Winogradskyella luteola]MBV7269474.1 hypothetical protein [Winogradskyella luteola]